jgi:hypothetical protein
MSCPTPKESAPSRHETQVASDFVSHVGEFLEVREVFELSARGTPIAWGVYWRKPPRGGFRLLAHLGDFPSKPEAHEAALALSRLAVIMGDNRAAREKARWRRPADGGLSAGVPR